MKSPLHWLKLIASCSWLFPTAFTIDLTTAAARAAETAFNDNVSSKKPSNLFDRMRHELILICKRGVCMQQQIDCMLPRTGLLSMSLVHSNINTGYRLMQYDTVIVLGRAGRITCTECRQAFPGLAASAASHRWRRASDLQQEPHRSPPSRRCSIPARMCSCTKGLLEHSAPAAHSAESTRHPVIASIIVSVDLSRWLQF